MPRAKPTDAQWQRLKPLRPGKAAAPGRAGFDQRKTVNGVLWIARTDVPRRGRPPYRTPANGILFTGVSAVGRKAGSLPSCLKPCRMTCICKS